MNSIKQAVKEYNQCHDQKQAEFERSWPYRVDLKLPLDENDRCERIVNISAWIKDHYIRCIPGPTVAYHIPGYTHMTIWFKRKDVSLLCKLAWSGI